MALKLKINGVEPRTDGSGMIAANVEAFYVDDEKNELAIGLHGTVLVPAADVASALGAVKDPSEAFEILAGYVVKLATTQVGTFDVASVRSAVEAYLERTKQNAVSAEVSSAINAVLGAAGKSPEVMIG